MNFEHTQKPSEPRKEKVSPESDAYRNEVLEKQNAYDLEEHSECFGNDTLARHTKQAEMYEALQDVSHENHLATVTWFKLSYPGKQPYAHFSDQERTLSEKSQKLFSKFSSKSSSKYFAGKFVEYALKNPLLAQQLDTAIQTLPEEFKMKKTPDVSMLNLAEAALLMQQGHYAEQIRARKLKSAQILEAINRTQLPPKLWFEMLRLHRESYIKKKEAILERIPEYRRRMRAAYLRHLESNDIYLVDISRLDALLDSVTVDVGDGIYDAFESNGGQFDSQTNTIFLSAQHLDNPIGGDDQLYKVYVHEVLHALSGKTILKETIVSKDEALDEEFDEHIEFEVTDYSVQRLGLHVATRFRWLNEAVTETVAKELTQDDESEFTSYSYRAERGILRHLVENYGIPLSLFTRAYFEHYEPEDRKSKTGPISGWKKLYQTINERCGSGYLLELDKKIKERGVTEVLRELQRQPRPETRL